MKREFFFPSADGRTQIHAIEWLPEAEPKAILQMSHGMVEYIDRYNDFAEYLCGLGFYVVGNDHLGHGKSIAGEDELGYFGQPTGNEWVIADLHSLRCRTEERYPGVPYFMLGHSMGSFLIRQYAMLHGEGLRGVIVMGTGWQPGPVLAAGKALCSLTAAVHGWHYRSDTVNGMAFSSNNKKFEPARTSQDWLSRDEENVDRYRADPLCTYVFTVNGFYQMFRGIQFVQKPQNVEMTPKELPLLIVSGAQDPVGGFGEGVKAVYESYKKAGMTHVEKKLYPEDRHEILNELDREQVFRDLSQWMEEKI